MTQTQALSLEKELLELCRKHGVWVTVERELKPDLRMIRVKEISIKIDK